MSVEKTSTDLKAEAIIDTFEQPSLVKDNLICKYILSEPLNTEIKLIQISKKIFTNTVYTSYDYIAGNGNVLKVLYAYHVA